MYRYKSQFGKEYLADIMKLSKVYGDIQKISTSKAKPDYSTFDIEVFYNILWCMAKSADLTIPDPMTWLDSFETFPVFEILPQVMDIIGGNSISTAKDTTGTKAKNA